MFLKLIKFIIQSYFCIAFKSLSNYFFRWLAYKSLLSRCPVLISHTMWSSNHISGSSCFNVFHGLGFSRSRCFRVQVFQSPGFLGSGSMSRVWAQVLKEPRFLVNLENNSRLPLEYFFSTMSIYVF